MLIRGILNRRCWDPTYIYKHRVGVNRFRFLLESMSALSESITSLNALSQLLVVRGDPAALIPELLKRWNIDTIAFEADVNAYPRARDAKIREIAKQAGVKVLEVHGHHLYNIDKVLESHGGKATTTMAALRKVGITYASHWDSAADVCHLSLTGSRATRRSSQASRCAYFASRRHSP